MTYSQFHAHLEWADVVHAILSGRVTEEHRRRLDVDRANRQILIQGRFPLYFPPFDFDEE